MAFILALVVRGFEAQAFVIPTGSMAPTLMGRHKEIACPQCGFVYAVNASEEVELRSVARTSSIPASACNCRFQARLDETPSFKGDRILVMMFPYDLPFLPGSGPPERWDVVVFRYPEEPEVSYIKRLVGLPGETIRIYHGDVFVKGAGSDKFTLARKPMDHQSAMQINVYDDRHRPQVPLPARPNGSAWRERERAGRSSIRQRVATSADGGPKENGPSCGIAISCPIPSNGKPSWTNRTLPREPRPRWSPTSTRTTPTCRPIHPTCSTTPSGDQEGAWMQPHWVGDLTLEATI